MKQFEVAIQGYHVENGVQGCENYCALARAVRQKLGRARVYVDKDGTIAVSWRRTHRWRPVWGQRRACVISCRGSILTIRPAGGSPPRPWGSIG